MFTVATNGYHWLFEDCIQSHRKYADKMGFEYVSVDRPRYSILGLEVAWLKISLIKKALENAYDWILFVDADTKISEIAPNILNLEEHNKSIYMAKGYSDRFNSGVILIKNTVHSHGFINLILDNIFIKLPKEDDVGWGENGHIIHFGKNNPQVQCISKKWNNNFDPKLKDYIRHYSAGPLRELHHSKTINIFLFKALKAFARVIKIFRRPDYSSGLFYQSLNDLTIQASRQFSQFKKSN